MENFIDTDAAKAAMSKWYTVFRRNMADYDAEMQNAERYAYGKKPVAPPFIRSDVDVAQFPTKRAATTYARKLADLAKMLVDLGVQMHGRFTYQVKAVTVAPGGGLKFTPVILDEDPEANDVEYENDEVSIAKELESNVKTHLKAIADALEE